MKRERPQPVRAQRRTLLDWLADRFPAAKRTTLRRMVQAGRVRINGRAARSVKEFVEAEDRVEVDDRPPARRAPVREGALPFPVVHEDDDILVIDKPAGLLTSTVPRERRATVLQLLRDYVKSRQPRARVGLIHRLDRDASGLLIFSKDDAAYTSLKSQFFHHTVERIYLAIVRGKLTPPSGRIDSRLLELPDGRVVTTRQPGKGQRAITEYETLAASKDRSLVRVRLQTGRKHQIRAHLAERAAPVLNDPLYADDPPSGRLMLVARELTIDHPRTGRRMTFRIDPPREMQALVPPAK